MYIRGKNVYKYDGVKEKYDLFGEEGSFKRSDFGMRFSIGNTIRSAWVTNLVL